MDSGMVVSNSSEAGAGAIEYAAWIQQHEGTTEQLLAHRKAVAELRRPCHVSVLIAPGPDRAVLRSTLDSVLLQTWSNWDVLLLGARPEAGGLDRVLSAQVHVSPQRGQESLEQRVWRVSRGLPGNDLVLLLPHDVQLRPDALLHLAVAAGADPLCELVYWDDDVAGPDGPRDPRFRPSWSPEMLIAHFYLGTSFAFRNRLLQRHGLRAEAGDAAWWDLVLRADLPPERVLQVPRVLSRLRVREVPPPSADAHTVVAQHVQRRHGEQAAVVRDGNQFRVRWHLEPWPTVTVVIPTRHSRDLLTQAFASIANTGYRGLDVIVVDNGGRSEANEAWYARTTMGLDVQVIWWDAPFNYSAVNNAAAAVATGEVLILLNDDTRSEDPGWIEELVGWAVQPGVGEVGTNLTGADGRLVHGGVIVGMNGFADHLFAGERSDAATIFGPVRSYRNLSAVTAACLAVRRSTFAELGGFDERFQLCGSDVALGLDLRARGYRNICTPYGGVEHIESATRGSDIPAEDFAVSYWRYQTLLHAGDPYYSPNLSLECTRPRLRQPNEPTSLQRIQAPLGRSFELFRQSTDTAHTAHLARNLVATRETRERIQAMHKEHSDPFNVQTVTWFLPGIDSPFYGGWNTILRIIDHLEFVDGVSNRLVIHDSGPELFIRAAITAAFPRLQSVPIMCTPDPNRDFIERLPPADVGIATHWTTAYTVSHAPGLRRAFYLIQDFEPLFYPGGTMYALAEETYRLGLYAICNTENLLRTYRDRYGGRGMYFQPAVDRSIFYGSERREPGVGEPVTLFVYARPGHWRNCWELASAAIILAKERLGDRLRVVTAGSWASTPGDLQEASAMRHLGLLEYRATGDLYRSSQIGLTLTVSAHPSYLPLEMMACGGAVVAFDNPAGHWLLRSGENSVLAEMNATALADAILRMVDDVPFRDRLAARGLQTIDEQYSDWPAAISGIHRFLSDPGGHPMDAGVAGPPQLTSLY